MNLYMDLLVDGAGGHDGSPACMVVMALLVMMVLQVMMGSHIGCDGLPVDLNELQKIAHLMTMQRRMKSLTLESPQPAVEVVAD